VRTDGTASRADDVPAERTAALAAPLEPFADNENRVADGLRLMIQLQQNLAEQNEQLLEASDRIETGIEELLEVFRE
jgi:hypothetical protein